jgi:predicted enzyme related to lactoylglutathione lyase
MGIDSGVSAVKTTGFTLQVYVPTDETATARSFYSSLFGREPEFEPHDDFFEWSPISGQECWFQVSGKDQAPPLLNRVRFRVIDLGAALSILDASGIARSEPSQLPGVVAFVDFSDPWGNQLGYYQDLVQSGQQAEYPGTSVNDDALFTRFANE